MLNRDYGTLIPISTWVGWQISGDCSIFIPLFVHIGKYVQRLPHNRDNILFLSFYCIIFYIFVDEYQTDETWANQRTV